jgi:RNA polymerase sigma-70 factor (ECF subfamily)
MSNRAFASEEYQQSDPTAEMIAAAVKDINRFSDLYNKYYLQIYYFIYKRTSDREISFDICSHVFLKAMENLKNYKYTGVPFEAWLFRIALNEIYGMNRKRKLDLVYNLDSDKVLNLPVDAADGEKEALINLVLEALQRLEKEEMDLIEMRYFSDMSLRDVAAVLNITETNAGVKVFRIIKKLKTILSKKLNYGIVQD